MGLRLDAMKKDDKEPKTAVTVGTAPERPFRGYKIIIGILFLLFCVLLYKNISYPLLWNDETDTAMAAKQILRYGYPKVHDGKNIMFLPEEPTWIGYKPAYDMNVAMTSGGFYFAAIGVFLADQVEDMYLKSALVRVPFATMGLFGLMIFVLSVKGLFPVRSEYYKFTAAFIFGELFSVSLFLHLREARYYSLVIFITGCFFYVFLKNVLHNGYTYKGYSVRMTGVLFVAYQINIVAFAACCLTAGVYEAWRLVAAVVSRSGEKGNLLSVARDELWTALRNVFPVLICFVLVVPFVMFYETVATAARATEHYGINSNRYISQLQRMFYILGTQECLYPVLFVKMCALVVWRATRDERREEERRGRGLYSVSLFITLFFVSFCVMVSKMPFLYTRYFIVLQPVMMLSVLTDLAIMFGYVTTHVSKRRMSMARVALVVVLVVVVCFNGGGKIGRVADYLYQITHQYRGPLDYLIPYIKENYGSPEKLVLATNYEELSYVFYLDCRVTLGYINKNLEEDLKYQPDLMIFRKGWGHDPKYFNQLLQKARYRRVSFPVFDSNVNNIAELDYVIHHQFRTRLTDRESEKVDILVRVE